MSTITPTLRPLSCWKSILRRTRQQKTAVRSMMTTTYHKSHLMPPPTPPGQTHVLRTLKAIAPPPSSANKFKDPVKAFQDDQISVLDPKGARTKLFARSNPESAKVGDILLVRLKNGDPFAGVCINIRRRGIDTGILLRNQLTRVGVEMWYKIYSPSVEGIEVVQRAEKRARRERLTYMRKPKHDRGSVQNIVLQYQRTKGSSGGSTTTKVQDGLKGGRRKLRKGRK